MAVAIHVDCDGKGCSERHNAGEKYAYFTTVDKVAAEWDDDALWVEADWLEMPDGWTVERVKESKRFPDGLCFRCEACS